ncbi:hypothetical protein [Methylomicrobium lacus]|uniref:hypothetical protein n=1 Tax=Methylomicrobium lacus TaxID=136992 RepID=UPI0035A8D7AD
MRKKATSEFQTRLWEAVNAIEQDSRVEVVVIMRPRSEHYRDIALIWGIVAAWLSLTYLMFSPELFEDWLIYEGPLCAFAAGYLIANIPLLTRFSVSNTRMRRNVEIIARALFQKGGIQHTQAKTGVLIYCSLLEKLVLILPDRGAEMALPAEEWQTLRAGLQSVFSGGKPRERLLEQLHEARPLFKRYLPPVEHDMNELPDNMEIDI